MSTIRRKRFVPMDCQVMGRMLGNTVRYALIHSDEAVLAEQVQRLVDDLVVFIPDESLAVIIDDIRVRATRWRPGAYHAEAAWERLLEFLDDYHRHTPRPADPSTSPVRMLPEYRYLLIYYAVLYALGDPTLLTSATCGWLRDIAPKLRGDQRASIASDIRCYLERNRPNEATHNDHHWRDALEFLSTLERQAFARSRPPKPRRR